MGNASGRKNEEGPSEVKDEEGGQQDMEFVRDEEHTSNRAVGMYAEPIFQSFPYGPIGYQLTFKATPQAPIVGIPRVGEVMHLSNYTSLRYTSYFNDAIDEKPSAVMITWSYGGNQVSVTGSWDNWERRELMYRSGQDFVILKKLPSGVYHYRFVVDEQFRYAPDLPWECDDSGAAFNILDVQDTVPDAPENLSEFKSPPSPESSYDNESLNEDFSKAPPEMPPQLLKAPIIEPSTTMVSHQSLPRPNHAVLNHLYVGNNQDNQPVAFTSTHRFRNKYVTVVLYKPPLFR
ncbi:putative snf1-kinase beta subunit [Tripterygium wilfordii]|uniref:Putative snf1-kinase beta subunit n=1 Tax=Tripterygium wilfordii TaxID=458696 RepID=A0A7J7D520_TRIWF|nr:SNF1-related protein kinase regulatory subunit beta-2-like [Tripterygium wilfordii]XP_038714375.1 SNF1-related protein kinase regulatory subunit beta-2-like [Tripterygium wilfordii]KAF5741369.1 putative snf1-kinase beta subunit [Tripterygium wilfordii]